MYLFLQHDLLFILRIASIFTEISVTLASKSRVTISEMTYHGQAQDMNFDVKGNFFLLIITEKNERYCSRCKTENRIRGSEKNDVNIHKTQKFYLSNCLQIRRLSAFTKTHHILTLRYIIILFFLLLH